MEEAFEDALEELKRVDHLFYVSLKYTRTVDVIRSLIGRMIDTFDFLFLSLLRCAKENNKLKDIPTTPALKCETIGKLYKDQDIRKHLDLYLLLRKFMRAPFTRREEYRRHVTMISALDTGTQEVNIDILEEYYTITRDFLKIVREIIRKNG